MLSAGCIRDGASECIGTCKLRFILLDGDNNNIAVETVAAVDVFVYDDEGHFFKFRRVERGKFGPDMTLDLSLPYGEYQVVCWANADDNSRFCDYTQKPYMCDSYLETVSYSTGSPVYYAPSPSSVKSVDGLYTMISARGVNSVKDMHFVCAYRTINVYIKDVENMPGYDGVNPFVLKSFLPYKCDFFMNVDPGCRDFEQQATEVEVPGKGTMLVSTSYSFYRKLSSEMHVDVRNSSGESTITPVNIRDYVQEKGIEDDREINILVTYNVDASVSITVPSWDNVTISPN